MDLKKNFYISFICMIMTLTFILLPTSVNAISFSRRAYYSPDSFSFCGTSSSITKNYDGVFMAIEATATSTSGNSYPVTLTVYIQSRNTTKTYTITSNGSMKKFDYIFLGMSGSSDVTIYCSCDTSDTITMSLTSYSW